MKKALFILTTTMFSIVFFWSCQKEENQQPIGVSGDGGQLKATETLIFSDDFFNSEVGMYSANPMRGETFITPASPQMKLSSVKIRLSKVGNPTGYAKVQLYNTTGIWGTGIQKPTGNPLATSDSINVATVLTTAQMKVFTFTGINRYLMKVNTSYCVVLCYKSGNSTNYIKLSMENTGNTDGNHVVWGPYGGSYTWLVETYRDMHFFVYGMPN